MVKINKETKKLIEKNAIEANRRVNEEKVDIFGYSKGDYVLDEELLQNKKVVTIKGAVDASFTVPKMKYRLIKLIIEGCENCVFNLEHSIITQHLEVSHCSSSTFNIEAKLQTLQVDLSNDIHISFGKGQAPSDTRVFHAGVRSLRFSTAEGQAHVADYVKDYNIVKGLEAKEPNEEMQFVTTFSDSKFSTVRVAREDGDIIPQTVKVNDTAIKKEI
mmetsp:Transcript_4035/g.4660  ORF Transcript_4035/g.4660 Transcript_4035/m.4660 type:complete len:217 (+) Transcript_4035:263-913(+)|eukprot:CAMPEP_0184010398 /NCGR_PEP_ID=MMETSP0954-20121128/3186_1 /TAXON_ID=627963 /ORGANISM="Aplanochytrium sp, Strain PBS07" /LENGTH=216 /DNA_ID=CAMNT_0026289973 /DNA_START=195 /DNA_END=845 /DNA_ORIENTATION=+